MAFDKVIDSDIVDGLLSDLGDAIREKNGESTKYNFYSGDMAAAVLAIASGSGTEQTIESYTVTPDSTGENISISVEDNVSALFVYFEDQPNTTEGTNTIMVLWFNSTGQTMRVSRGKASGTIRIQGNVYAITNGILNVPCLGTSALFCDGPYRVIKVKDTLT